MRVRVVQSTAMERKGENEGVVARVVEDGEREDFHGVVDYEGDDDDEDDDLHTHHLLAVGDAEHAPHNHGDHVEETHKGVEGKTSVLGGGQVAGRGSPRSLRRPYGEETCGSHNYGEAGESERHGCDDVVDATGCWSVGHSDVRFHSAGGEKVDANLPQDSLFQLVLTLHIGRNHEGMQILAFVSL